MAILKLKIFTQEERQNLLKTKSKEDKLRKYLTPGSHEGTALAEKLLPVLEGLTSEELTMVGRGIQAWVSGKYDWSTPLGNAYGYGPSDSPAIQLGFCLSKEASNMGVKAQAKKLKQAKGKVRKEGNNLL